MIQRQTAVITGASQGIGQAIAARIARNCRTTILLGRSMEGMSETIELVRSAGSAPKPIAFDLSQKSAAEELDKKIGVQLDEIDLLVNCGGVYLSGPISTSGGEDLDTLMQTNVRGALLLSKQLMSPLIKNQGDIVFVNSSIVLGAGKDAALFASSQHALKAIADALRAEFNSCGVRVTSIYPGRVATPRQEKIFKSEGRKYPKESLLQANDVAEVISACIALPGTAEVTDIYLRPAANFNQA